MAFLVRMSLQRLHPLLERCHKKFAHLLDEGRLSPAVFFILATIESASWPRRLRQTNDWLDGAMPVERHKTPEGREILNGYLASVE
jgi:hypothetical protein